MKGWYTACQWGSGTIRTPHGLNAFRTLKFIVNINYLIEVVDNVCHFYPPFDEIDYVKVGRLYRKKLIDRFLSI